MNNDKSTRFNFRRILRWALVVLAGVFLVAEFRSCGYGPYRWSVSSVDFSPNGESLAVGICRWQRVPWEVDPRYLIGGIKQTVKLVDVSTGKNHKTVVEESNDGITRGVSPEPISWAKFSPDGRILAIGLWDGSVRLWDTLENTATPLNLPNGFEDRFVRSIDFAPDGKRLAVLHRNVPLIFNIEDLDKPVLMGDWQDELNEVGRLMSPYSLCFSPDGKSIAYGSEFSPATILESDTGHLIRRFQRKDEDPKRKLNKKQDPENESITHEFVEFSPDGETLVFGGYKRGEPNSVKIVNARTGDELARFDNRYGNVKFSPDGKTLVITGHRKLTFIDLTTNKIRMEMSSLRRIRDLTFSPDATKLALGDTSGNVTLIESESGDVLWKTNVVGIQKYFVIPKWVIAFFLFYLAYRVGVRKNTTDRTRQIEYELA